MESVRSLWRVRMPLDLQRIQNVFQAVVEAAPAERIAALERECGADAELRRQVEAILKAHDDSHELPAVDSTQTGAYVPQVQSGQIFVGRYKLREKLGEGGMGTVFVADQTQPVARRVALKVIKSGMDSRRLMARFEQERQALALMDHPNIAKVFDAGVDEHGRPYFAMELVKGLPLTKYCDDARLTPKQRLELFVPVCQAVQHAHQKGIIHRDLKPSNILVGLYDGRPVPKVIDFGVAKATGPRLTEQSIYTEVGSLIGTLEYMSPEQAELNNLDIDTRSDIYSLGVILYELLTGSVPFSRKELEKAGFAEMLRLIKDSEPPRPSTKLSGSGTLPSIAAARHTEPNKLTALVRGELDWIVLKALEKDRGRRYETAIGFAMDVQRYLAGEAVQAAPASAAYRLRKFIRRNKGPVLAASLVLLALLAGIAGTSFGLVKAESARREAVASAKRESAAREQAEAKEAEADAVVKFFEENVFAAGRPKGKDGGLGKDVTLRQAIDESLPKLSTSFKDQPLVEARLRRSLALTFHNLGDEARAADQAERAHALFARHLGAEHPSALKAMNGVGLTYVGLGRNKKALKLFEELLAIQRRTLPPDSMDTRVSMLNTAMCYGKLNQPAEALERFNKVLSAFMKELPPDHLLILDNKANVATCYSALGRHDEALKLRKEILESRKRNYPDGDIKIFGDMMELAGSYSKLGQYKEAINLLEDSLDAHRRIYPADHPVTLYIMDNLGVSYAEVGRLQEAIKIQQEALAGCRRTLPPEHATTLRILINLAGSYMQINRHAEALPLIKEVLGKANQSTLPPAAVPMAITMALECCQKLGDATQWRALAAALENLTPSVENHYNTACCWSCSAAIQAKGRASDAARLARNDANRAMKWLQKAITAGWKDAEHIKQDTDLDFLRDRDDFKKLLADLEMKKP